jgi:DNA-binding MarR family transcriptional regulator
VTAVSATSATGNRVEELLSWRVAVTGRLIRTWLDAELGDLRLGAQGLGVLLRLLEEDGLTQVELARRQRVEAPSVCRMIDRLAREGLVERRPHPADRRAVRVHLTPAGRRAAKRGGRAVETLEERAFAGLEPAERETLAALLGRVLADLPSVAERT